jgi:DNA-binding MarR family transcriptional regulator/N-acetylglutamate synthase-like GNAT family acetyltransferase
MIDSQDINTVRAFNRFWTERIGLLQAGLLDTPYSLTEARVIFELGRRAPVDVAELRRALALDSGYLSRIIGRFKADGLVVTQPSPQDARRQVVELTARGGEVCADLGVRSADQIAALIGPLADEDRRRLLAAMSTIREVIDAASPAEPSVIRTLRSGDLGWVVARHGVVYAEEYAWDQTFEALVARIVADYVDHHIAGRESAWIAELDGEAVGCVFCVRRDEETAQLRLLLVEPKARGFGIGSRLVDECIRFARGAGYTRMVLWTNDVLVSARRIYEARGFELVESEPHHSFGHDLVGQTWQRALA